MELIRKESIGWYSREFSAMIETLDRLTTKRITAVLIYSVWLRAAMEIGGDLPALVRENGALDPELHMYPPVLAGIQDRVFFLNMKGEEIKSFSLSVWVHTLRSLMRPELLLLARRMWNILMSSKPNWEKALKQVREEDIRSGIPHDDVLKTERRAQAILKCLPPKQLVKLGTSSKHKVSLGRNR
jgi:hypothetical protein